MMTSEEWNDKTTGAYLDALVQWLQKLGRDMDLHANEEWDEHEDVFAAVNAITDLRAQHSAQAAEIERLTARAEAAEAQVANAGAVMVEACAQANEKRGSVFGRDGAAVCRALSTLSPIAAAARVLLAQTEAANDPEIGPWLRAIAE